MPLPPTFGEREREGGKNKGHNAQKEMKCEIPGPGGESYQNYDTKYNVYDDDFDLRPEAQPDDDKVVLTKANSRGPLLLIGIISGAIIAIVLIIIIVLKMRTRGDPRYKMEEARAFEAASRGEDVTPATASAAAPVAAASVLPPMHINGENANGFHHGKAAKAAGGESSKPVKEWYV